MNLIKHIPNTITCLNLFSGCMSIVAAIGGDLRTAFIWIVGLLELRSSILWTALQHVC